MLRIVQPKGRLGHNLVSGVHQGGHVVVDPAGTMIGVALVLGQGVTPTAWVTRIGLQF